MGVTDAAQGIGGGGGIAAGDIDVPPVGGGDEPAARACPELRAKARLVRKGCTDCRGGGPNGGVVSGGVVPERGKTGVVGGRKDEGLFGDGGVRRSDGVEQVDDGIANGIVAVGVEELTGRAVKAVKWHVVGVDCATTRTEDGARSAEEPSCIR